MEYLQFQPFFEGGHHPSGEAAKSSEQLVATDHSFRISNEKLSKQILPKCENLTDKIYLKGTYNLLIAIAAKAQKPVSAFNIQEGKCERDRIFV